MVTTWPWLLGCDEICWVSAYRSTIFAWRGSALQRLSSSLTERNRRRMRQRMCKPHAPSWWNALLTPALSSPTPCQGPEFPSNWCALGKAFEGEKILHYLQSALHLRARPGAQRAPAQGSKDWGTPEPCTGVQNERNHISLHFKTFLCLLDGCRQEAKMTKLCAATTGAQTVVAAGWQLPHHCRSYKSCCSNLCTHQPRHTTTHLLKSVKVNRPAPCNTKARKHLGKVVFKTKFFNNLNYKDTS